MATGKKKTVKKAAARKKATKKKTAARTAGTRAAKKSVVKKSSAVEPAAGSTSSHSVSGVLNIDYSLCRGCGGCADAFPRLFEMRAELAWVTNPESFDPKRDGGVMTVCPYYAILLE